MLLSILVSLGAVFFVAQVKVNGGFSLADYIPKLFRHAPTCNHSNNYNGITAKRRSSRCCSSRRTILMLNERMGASID
jgi:hypothetical protein